MAKILASILPSPASKLAKKRKEWQWVTSELNSLQEVTIKREQNELAKLKHALNKRLDEVAFAACDKNEYISEVNYDKLLNYDVKNYMNHRALNHGLIKKIFKAKRENKPIDSLILQHNKKYDELIAKREKFVAKLEEEKRSFLDKYSSSDNTEYDKLKIELMAEYEQKAQKIKQDLQSNMEKTRAKLEQKAAKLQEEMAEIKKFVPDAAKLDDGILLEVKGLKMYFGGLKAVDDLTFNVKKGEIFGLIGPNGAGKTTVFNCITRFYNATGGEMYFENRQGEVVDLRSFKVHDVILQGISRTFQNVELVKEISVLDNLLVACTREYRSGFWSHLIGLPMVKKEEAILRLKAMRILKFMGIEAYASWYAMGLPYGILKKVEIARALMNDSKLIIMDEPAAGLNDTETADLAKTIKRIRDEFGATILLVEHDMKLVMGICDTVCAISFGQMLAIGTPQEVQANQAVQQAYLGTTEE